MVVRLTYISGLLLLMFECRVLICVFLSTVSPVGGLQSPEYPTCETQEQCFFSEAQNICFSLFYFGRPPYPAHLFFTLFFFDGKKHTVLLFFSKFGCVSHVG